MMDRWLNVQSVNSVDRGASNQHKTVLAVQYDTCLGVEEGFKKTYPYLPLIQTHRGLHARKYTMA